MNKDTTRTLFLAAIGIAGAYVVYREYDAYKRRAAKEEAIRAALTGQGSPVRVLETISTQNPVTGSGAFNTGGTCVDTAGDPCTPGDPNNWFPCKCS
jgi:hypothetical protein